MSLQIETQPFQFNSSLTTLDGLTASGAVRIGNNLTVLGNISAGGTATFANTVFTTTSALCAIANSTGPALYIGQQGIGDLASFYDLSPTPVEVLHVGASIGIPGVGIYTSTPNTALTVVGDISATGVLYTANSVNWNSSYTTTNSNSANWNLAYTYGTAYQNTSGSFATNTLLRSTSALLTPLTTTNTLTSQLVLNTTINTVSGNWNTAYQSVSSQPYTLADATSSIKPIRGNNTASGCYSIVGSGCSNTIAAAGNFGVIAGGRGNTNCGNCMGVVGGGVGNTSSAYASTVGGGFGNTASGNRSVVAGGTSNIAFGVRASVLGGGCNAACGNCSTISGGYKNTISTTGGASVIVGGVCNTASNTYSNINGGFGNFAPLRSSIIGGGDFNHTGGYCPTPISNTSTPTNLATAQLSGNGTCTSINLGGAFGSCFSTTGTNAVSIVYTTSGAPLSAGNFAVANIVSQPNTTCIIVNGDYSVNQNSSASLSATCVFVYDRLLNNTGFHSTIGGGKLNTASGQYDVVVGGIRNSAIGNCSFIGGGFRNFAQSCAAAVGGGCQNTASGQYSAILGGTGNQSPGRTAGVGAGSSNCANGNCSFIGGGISNNTGANSTSFIGGGNTNVACGTSSNIVGGQSNTITSVGNCSTIAGGRCNIISSEHSFIASGSANDTKGFGYTFILGTGLSATQVNYTYVNNISAQSTISAPSISAVTFYGDGSKLSGITSSGGGGLYLPLSGGTMTGGLSAPSLSANNFYGSGSETVLSDGVGSNDTGNGTNTLSLNFTNGTYIGGSGTLNATNVNVTSLTTTSLTATTIYASNAYSTNYFYLTANGPAISTITNFFSSPGTSTPLIDTLSANSVYEIEYHLFMQKTVTTGTILATLSANAGASSFTSVGFGGVYQPAAAATNSIVSGTGPTLALTSPTLGTTNGYYYHIYKAFVLTGNTAPKITFNITSNNAVPQVGSYRKLVKIV
jgi:hypothetical protein